MLAKLSAECRSVHSAHSQWAIRFTSRIFSGDASRLQSLDIQLFKPIEAISDDAMASGLRRAKIFHGEFRPIGIEQTRQLDLDERRQPIRKTGQAFLDLLCLRAERIGIEFEHDLLCRFLVLFHLRQPPLSAPQRQRHQAMWTWEH